MTLYQRPQRRLASTNRLRCLLGIAAAALVAVPATAQQGQMPPWLNVAIVQVKSGAAPDFEDRIKEFLAARQAAGMPVGQVFQIAAGHPNEYHIVTPAPSLAINDNPRPPMEPAQAAQWGMRIMQTVESVRFFHARTYPQHGLDGNPTAAQPTLLLLRSIRVASGREAEYEAWVTSQYMPALRQTSMAGHTMSRGAFGDSPQMFYHAYPLANWAALDQPDPLLGVLGQRRYDQLFDALDGIVESHQIVIARIRADLMPQPDS